MSTDTNDQSTDTPASKEKQKVFRKVKPSADQVKTVREGVQDFYSFGITEAQDWCANALHTKRRPWQQWESGDRTMHPAFWELLNIKTENI